MTLTEAQIAQLESQRDHYNFCFAFVDVCYERALKYAERARCGDEEARALETIFVRTAARVISEVVREAAK